MLPLSQSITFYCNAYRFNTFIGNIVIIDVTIIPILVIKKLNFFMSTVVLSVNDEKTKHFDIFPQS